MKNIMIKSVCAVSLLSLLIFACSQNLWQSSVSPQKKYAVEFDKNGYWEDDKLVIHLNDDNTISYYGKKSLYGAYLAARVAHLRQDFTNAAEYYRIVGNIDDKNMQINRMVYVMLTSLGKIDEAVPYAQKEVSAGNNATIAPLIIAVNEFAEGNYTLARESMIKLDDKIHNTLITPLFAAWTYAGEYNEAKAIAEIDKIVKDPALATLKLFHKGMIYDYLGNKTKASEMFSAIVKEHPKDVTYRVLEVITDFYVRNGDKELARRISNQYNDNGLLAILLADIDKKIDAGSTKSKAVIDTPQKGLAEALFNVGTMFRASVGGNEFAQIYIAVSSYLNPQYEVSKIALANVLEEVGLLKEANRYYNKVGRDSGSYFIARMKMIENYNTMEDYDSAEQQLILLLQDYPNNTQLLSDLGNIYSNVNNDADAVKMYNKAIGTISNPGHDDWIIYYALAVSYDKLGEKNKSEEMLMQALTLSRRDVNVLNYLGYSWLERGKNIDEAVKMILEAYNRYPYDGHILDSVGWIYFRLGKYNRAIEFLEQAAAMIPGNAVVNEHLGDAYWFGGRRNEAVFQWKHALDLKEDSDIVDKDAVKAKIEEGFVDNIILHVKDIKLRELLDNMNLEDK